MEHGQLICIAEKFRNYLVILVGNYETLPLYALFVLISRIITVHFIQSGNKLAKCFKASDKVIRKFYRPCFAGHNVRILVGTGKI